MKDSFETPAWRCSQETRRPKRVFLQDAQRASYDLGRTWTLSMGASDKPLMYHCSELKPISVARAQSHHVATLQGPQIAMPCHSPKSNSINTVIMSISSLISQTDHAVSPRETGFSHVFSTLQTFPTTKQKSTHTFPRSPAVPASL